MNAHFISEIYLDDIESRGYTIINNALSKSLTAKLMLDCYRINPEFSVAGIGRKHDLHVNKTVRKDKTF